MTEAESLLEFCVSDAQRKVIQAVVDNGTKAAAARVLGRDQSGLRRTYKLVKKNAALRGWATGHDMTHPAPEGFSVSGVSTLYDAETGAAKIQWVKTKQDTEAQLKVLQESCLDTFGSVKPLPAIKVAKKYRDDLLVVLPMGDPHVGLYAWHAETGEDFDADKARAALCAATDNLVDKSPPAGVCVILNLGDFFHSDNMENKTRRSGNVLDVDTRWPRVLEIGIDAMVRCIRRALEKHKKVIVRNNIGNHDEHSSIMLSIALRSFFRKNKRVEIDTSPDPFWYYRHGKVLIGSTHGDKTRPADLPSIMATDMARDWGETTKRYWYTGHIHHRDVKEFRGCVTESFRTLAARDAWHHGEGYRSGRDMVCIVHHKTAGEISRYTCGVEML